MNLEILKIASNTDNNKVLNDHTHNSKLKNPICGDVMHISVKVVKDNIVDFGYQCKSCIYCQASVSLLSRNSINKTIVHVKNLLKISETFFEKKNVTLPKEWSVFNKIFNKQNISRKECLLLPFKTLAKALKS
jgi:nitrogen fixation NifU-like protein